MGLKGGISIDADSGPLRYVLWCCSGICHQPDTFIQIGSGHTVSALTWHDHKVNHSKVYYADKDHNKKTKITDLWGWRNYAQPKNSQICKKKLFVNLPSTNFAEIKSNGPVGQWFFTQIFCVASNKRWHIISWNKKSSNSY